MASTSASATATSFSALLKQSKFATYSPSIAQVYVTHGGHAARGDWGVKRPLSARRRNHALLIQSIDSREQQTEFRSGEPEARMVQRWQETGMDVAATRYGPNSNWKAQLDSRPSRELAIDSEFCAYTPEVDVETHPKNSALRLKTPASTRAIPDVNLMSTKEFDRYLERVRKLRPAFRKYIQQRKHLIGGMLDGKSAPSTPELYRVRSLRQGDEIENGFLSEMSYQLHGSPHSQALEPYPHRNGGLYYPQPNSFQTSLLYPAIPARFTSPIIGTRNPSGSVLFSAAGMTIDVSPSGNEDVSPVDWHRENVVAGRTPIRFINARLQRAPQAVATERSAASELSFSAPAGRSLRRNKPDLTEPPFSYPSGLRETSIEITGATVREQNIRSNPHPPGSILYSIAPDIYGRPKFGEGPRAPNFSEQIYSLTHRLSGANKNRPKKGLEKMLGALDALLNRVSPGPK